MQETIKIASKKHPQGWVLISASDFDPKSHRVFDPERKKAEDNAAPLLKLAADHVAAQEAIAAAVQEAAPQIPVKKNRK